MINQEPGIFIGEGDLPPHIIKKIVGMARLENKDVKEYVIDLIIDDCKNFDIRKQPVLDRAVKAGMDYLKDNFLTLGR